MTTNMSRAEAEALAADLFARHGLTGWHLRFNRARRSAGVCDYRRRTITLSLPLLGLRPYADSLNTLTHEVAHALTKGHGHDRVWRLKHRELGGDGERCVEYVDMTAPWLATCEHGRTFTKYRAPSGTYRCRCAGRPGDALVWLRNEGALT